MCVIVVLAGDYVSFSGSCPLGEVCLCVPACRRWGVGGRQGSMRCLGCILALGMIKDSAASFNSRNNSLNRDSVIWPPSSRNLLLYTIIQAAQDAFSSQYGHVYGKLVLE